MLIPAHCISDNDEEREKATGKCTFWLTLSAYKHHSIPTSTIWTLWKSPSLLSPTPNHSSNILSHPPVNELIDEDNVSGLNLLSQGATGCGNQQMCAALRLHCPDVGLVVHVGRHYRVLSPMPNNGERKVCRWMSTYRNMKTPICI